MHADDAQSPRGGEYTSHLVEEDGMIDPDLLSLTKELGRGAFGVGAARFLLFSVSLFAHSLAGPFLNLERVGAHIALQCTKEHTWVPSLRSRSSSARHTRRSTR